MTPFLHAHATHPDAGMALALAAAQIDAQAHERGERGTGQGRFAPTLGWVYLTEHFAPQAEPLLADLRRRWPGVAWVGAAGIGIAASGVEYFDEPALVLMLAELPRSQFRVYSGTQPLGDFAAHTAQVHADPATADLAELIADLSGRTATGYLFGGLASARTKPLHIADAVLQGGLSGVAFSADVALVSRVSQGCQPVGPLRTVSESQHNVVTRLDGTGALDCLLADLGLAGHEPREALPQIRQTLVGLVDPADRQRQDDGDDRNALAAQRGAFGPDTRVRNLVGIDPARRGLAIGEIARPGVQLAFCQRNTVAARRDLVRICAEIREELEPENLPENLSESNLPESITQPGKLPAGGGAAEAAAGHGIAGAIYVSCSGRGGLHFGAPSAELAIVQHALGDVPLVGFFAAGEIARHHLYGYTGVLTVFRQRA